MKRFVKEFAKWKADEISNKYKEYSSVFGNNIEIQKKRNEKIDEIDKYLRYFNRGLLTINETVKAIADIDTYLLF